MSKERHPNLQATGFTTDLLVSLLENLRGPAAKQNQEAMTFLMPLVITFVTNVSITLDKKFGVGDATKDSSINKQGSSSLPGYPIRKSTGSSSFEGSRSEAFKRNISQKLQKLLIRLLLPNS